MTNLTALFAFLFLSIPLPSQQPADSQRALYDQIRTFDLGGSSFKVENLVIKRDRVVMTFTGAFYFSAPAAGRVTGAVFRGQGAFQAPVPPSAFEEDNVRRMLKADGVGSTFQNAVFVFTDDLFDQIKAGGFKPGEAAPTEARKLAAEWIPRVLKETGANLAARALTSIVNRETPGFFASQFEGGPLGRFSFIYDEQNRIPVATFSLNGGEKGLIYTYREGLYGNDILMAFYSLQDYDRGVAAYSDINDLVDMERYNMDIDVREPKKALKVNSRIDMVVRSPRLRALPLVIGESLPEYDSMRLKRQMRVKGVKVGGAAAEVLQEDWEGGFTVLLPAEAAAGQKLSVEVDAAGDFMRDVDTLPQCNYPLSNVAWYPRHGYLDRAAYDLTFHHNKRVKIAATGARLKEAQDANSKEDMVTEYRLDQPVAMASFAIGPFERHAQKIKWESGGETPLEFCSLPGSMMVVKEDFILAELDNAIRYFSALFGKYPYPNFGAAVHPYGFGQGLATMLMIPPASRANKYTYAFISHETSHQWWGNIVAWRSYRDQWLSEGFAEYSGVLYAGRRENPGAQRELINELRNSLKDPPETTTGIGQGRLNDVGPIILGHRLETSKTIGSYSTLVYNKGALVLRMLHHLFLESPNGAGKPFFDMMTDFVNRYRGGAASTDEFRKVATEHFLNTPVAKKYGLKDLDWFFRQWVMQTALPSYRLEYAVEDQPDGAAVLRGKLYQDNAPDNWLVILPLNFSFGGNQSGAVNVHVIGKETEVNLKLPRKPAKVELDPDNWILSEKTTTKSR